MSNDNKKPLTGIDLPFGLGGVFRGVADLLQVANDIADHAPDDGSATQVHRTITSRAVPGANAAWGVSVRVIPPRRPSVIRVAQPRGNGRKDTVIDDTREPTVDIFDEGDHCLVVAEMPGIDAAAVQWNVHGEVVLVIRAESADRKYYKRIDLPAPIDDQTITTRYANGVLELRAWKQQR